MTWDDAQRKLVINAHMLARYRMTGHSWAQAARSYAERTLNPVPTHVRIQSGRTFSIETVPQTWAHLTGPTPGACGDPECHVLHDDPAKPVHPPWYVDSRTTT